MQQFQINKYIRLFLSMAVTVIGGLLFFADNVNWNNLLGAKTGAAIVMIIGLIKIAYAALAPSAGKPTVPTGKSVITQVVPEGHTQPNI